MLITLAQIKRVIQRVITHELATLSGKAKNHLGKVTLSTSKHPLVSVN